MSRILFTAVSAHGHVLPMAPLMGAALESGHTVALIASAELRPLLESDLPFGVELLPAGPMPLELATLAAERTQGDLMQPTVEGIGETFGGVLLDLSLPAAIPAARSWMPDVVVADVFNSVGPFLSALLDVPWWRFSMTVHPPTSWMEAIDESAAERYRSAGLEPRDPAGTVQIWPEELTVGEDPTWSDAPVHDMAFSAHRGRGSGEAPEAPSTGRPRVVASMGTIFSDAGALGELAARLAEAGVDAVVTTGLALGESVVGSYDRSVTWVPFTPIDGLLRDASAIVTVAGAGTVLAALAHGVPLVLWPHGADQPLIAERVEATGAAIGIAGLDELPGALRRLLADPDHAARAGAVAESNASRPAPAAVLQRMLESR